MPEGSRRSLALIVLPYAAFAALWIVLSDLLLNLLVSDPRSMGQLQTYKGLAFVAITTLLLYFLVRRQQQRRDAVESERDRLRRRLLSMIESITDGFVALDRDWHYLYINTRAAEMFGRRPQDLIGKHIWTEFPEGKGQPFHRAYERAVAEQKPVYLEDYYAPWDRWFENRIYPTPDGLTILFQDITERKQVQARLAENANQLRLFVEHSPAAIAMFDREMRYLVVSHRWVEDYGLGDRQIAGRSHYEIFPEIPERWREIHRRCLAGAVERCEEDPFPRPDGSTDWVHWEVRPWHQASGEIGGIIIFSEVITARKRAEEAVRVSEERLRLTLDAAHMGTFDWDIPNNRITWSRWHKELWGFGPGEFDGTYESFSERVHPEDLPGINTEVERCMAARAPFACEFRVIWPDGSVRWVSGRGEFTFDAGGRPLRMRGVVLEITERKQAEEKLREYAHQLEILSRRLLAAQEEERQRIARELHDQAGQALTALKITLQMPASATRRAESLALADEVLAQVRALSFDLRPSLLDDLGLPAALCAHAERLCKRAKLALRLDLAHFETRPAGEIETACFRIAQEALTNVLRHAGAGAVTITLQREGDAVLLAVRDDGRGFDPARAADASLGLLGMRERAELAGGRFEIESASGRGTTVRARLPWRAREGLT